MRFELDRLPVILPLGGRLALHDAEGVSMQVLCGRVWITREGSPDDVFVDHGGLHRFAGPGRVVISAEGRCDARVAFDAPLSASTPSLLARVAQKLQAKAANGWNHATMAFEGG